MKRLLLVGGGHAHVEVLRQFGMRPAPDVDITLVSPQAATPYSGMLPGFIAGHYSWGDCHIQLVQVAGLAYATFLQTAVTRLDPERGLAFCADGSEIGFDIVSIDVGSTPNQQVPGSAQNAIAVKPVERFVVEWARILAAVRAREIRRVAVVGGGAGGIEVLLAMQHRCRSETGDAQAAPAFVLATASRTLLPTHPWPVRRLFERTLAERRVEVHLGREVARVDPGNVIFNDGSGIEADRIVWVVTAAPAPWLAQSGLATDARGFIAVDDTLRSTSHPRVFGAGDCVSQVRDPAPKSGVFAVRQGPVLAENLRCALRGEALAPYRRQRLSLSLISTGDRYAVASRGPFVAWGAWVWRWKDRIDRMFMMKYMGMM